MKYIYTLILLYICIYKLYIVCITATKHHYAHKQKWTQTNFTDDDRNNVYFVVNDNNKKSNKHHVIIINIFITINNTNATETEQCYWQSFDIKTVYYCYGSYIGSKYYKGNKLKAYYM